MMSTSTHTVHRLWNADGSPRYLQPDSMVRLLNCLAGNCKQLGVTFRLNSACLNVITMEVTGLNARDEYNNECFRRQAEEFAKGYIAGLDATTEQAEVQGEITIAALNAMSPADRRAVLSESLKRVKQRSTVEENIAVLDAALVEAKSRVT